MSRIYSPSPTVRASRVPLYMQGFPALGQDSIDTSDAVDTSSFDFSDSSPIIPDVPVSVPIAPDIGTGIPAVSFADTQTLFHPDQLQPLLDQGFTQSEAEMIASAAASGHISNAQFQSILAGNHSYDQIASTIFGAVKTAAGAVSAAKPPTANRLPQLGPGAAPRVATQPAGASSSLFTQQTLIRGVPDVALIGGGLLLALVAMGGKR